MLKLYDGGAYLVNGTEIITDEAEVKAKTGREVSKEEARTQTMAYGILEAHNISGNMERLQIKFDKLTSHDITFGRNYSDSESFRTGEVSNSICIDELSQLTPARSAERLMKMTTCLD